MKQVLKHLAIIIAGSILLMFTLSCKKNEITTTPGSNITDIDGNIYHTVIIGTQTWMVENLKVTHYRNGDSIPNIADNAQWCNDSTGAYAHTGLYCNYNNDNDNAIIYGRLYNWYAINDSRNICPDGWHIPSDAEWSTLINYLGGNGVAGKKMKETGTTNWNKPNDKYADNGSGFTALPAGSRGGANCYISFEGLKCYAHFWSAAESNNSGSCICGLSYDYSGIERNFCRNNRKGLSVRCIKD